MTTSGHAIELIGLSLRASGNQLHHGVNGRIHDFDPLEASIDYFA